MGINVDNYFQSASNALKAADLPVGRQVRVVIENCEEIMFKSDDGKDQPKLKLSFQGKEKGLILNKTNAMTISHVLGGEVSKWFGQEIFLFSTQVDFGGQMVPAIRVNMPLQEANPNEDVGF